MARISPIQQHNAPQAVDRAFEKYSIEYKDGISNMKATLGYSALAVDAYLQWHPLYESVKKLLGERLANLFAFAISQSSQCCYCDTVFRKKIIESGENPDDIALSPAEKNLIDFGSAIVKHHGNIANHVFNSVAAGYTKKDLILLVAFAGQMIAANIFNNVVETELDNYLLEYLPASKSIWE